MVYSLLLLNFAFYIAEDWNRAMHVLRDGGTFLQWTSEFATSIDELAWFGLLFMFELETYALEDETWDSWVTRAVHWVRLLCYLMLAHTIFAYAVEVIELRESRPVSGIDTLCELAERNRSFVYNLEYTEITAGNCAEVGGEGPWFWRDSEVAMTTEDGLQLERWMARVDLVDAVTWLLIMLAIEVVVRLQARDITSGRLFVTANVAKALLYGVLLLLVAYWARWGHWLYVWDELLWIGGFMAIEMNMSEWRDEIQEEQEAAGHEKLCADPAIASFRSRGSAIKQSDHSPYPLPRVLVRPGRALFSMNLMTSPAMFLPVAASMPSRPGLELTSITTGP